MSERLKEAIECYKRAINIKRDYSLAFYNLGNILMKTERYDEAVRAYQKIIKINKKDHSNFRYMKSVINNLSISLEKKGK